MKRKCEWCGTHLDASVEDWKTMHPACYGAWRRREDALTDEAVEARVKEAVEAQRMEVYWYGFESGQQHASAAAAAEHYRRGVEDGKRSAAAVDLDKGMLRLLLQLTHPDKHDGSPASVKAAAYLNGLRERLD